jgi:hypothetical protein
MTWRREDSCPYRDFNSDPSVVQPVASRYTDYAILAPINTVIAIIILIITVAVVDSGATLTAKSQYVVNCYTETWTCQFRNYEVLKNCSMERVGGKTGR